jgi:hypothetical protein
MHEIDYTNKPSITTLRAAIRKAAKAGKTFIVLTWGENQITIERVDYAGGYRPQWVGRGWIGRNGGQDLAHELEISSRTGAPANRLIVKHIGA